MLPTFSPRSRRNALAMVGILLGAGLVPVVLSDPAQDLVDDIFGQVGDETATAEQALQSALQQLDPVQAKLDETLAAIDQSIEDNVNPDGLLAPYFLDQNFDQGPAFSNGETARRLGGWGDWAAQGDSGWRPDPRAPKIGEQGLGFWDGNLETQRYPIASTPLDSYAVSPRISLRALSVAADADAGACVNNVNPPRCVDAAIERDLASAGEASGEDLSVASGAPHRIQLHLGHRFNFATTTNMTGTVGTDGGRIELYTCKPGTCKGPTQEDLLAFREGRSLAAGLTARVVQPLAGDPDAYQPTTAFAAQPAFSGPNAQSGNSQATFDITAWAGQDAWVVFHAAVTAKGQSPKSYFDTQSNSHFDLEKGFFGWTLSQVYVAGPAWQHDVRIDQILDPAFRESPTRYKASEGMNEFAFLLLNRGAAQDTVEPTLSVEDAKDSSWHTDCTPDAPVTLRAGEVRRVRFTQCVDASGAMVALTLTQGHEYAVAFAAELATDLHPADNRNQGLVVRAEPLSAARLVDGTLSLQPAIGDDTQPRQLRLTLENPGLSPARITAAIKVRYQPNPGADQWIESGDPQYPRVTLNAGASPHVVSVSADRAEQVVVVPVGDGAAPSRATLSWTLLLPTRGVYRVDLLARQAGSEGSPIVAAQMGASTFLSAPAPFLDNFDDSRQASIVEGPEGSVWRDWQVQSTRSLVPPQCEDPKAAPYPCPTEIWEISDVEPDTRADPSTTDQVTDVGRDPAVGSALCPVYPPPSGSAQSYTCLAWINYYNNGGYYATGHEGDDTRGSAYVLTGRPLLDLDAIGANQRFSQLRVDYQVAWEDLHFFPGFVDAQSATLGPATISVDYAKDDMLVHDPVGPYQAVPQPGTWIPLSRRPIAVVDNLTWFDNNAASTTEHLMKYLDGQWVDGSRTIEAPLGNFTAAEIENLALTFRLPLPGDRIQFDGRTRAYATSSRGCPARADDAPAPDFCPTWRVAHAGLHGKDAATGDWIPLALFNGNPTQTLGAWASFAETSHNKAINCAKATLPQGEELHCMGFHKRAVSDLESPATILTLEDEFAKVARGRGFWTNMEPDAFGNLQYRGGQHERLISPALRIPISDGNEQNNPRLQFAQLHKLGTQTVLSRPGDRYQYGTADQTTLDAVTLMVRRLNNDGTTVYPTTPWIPVYTEPTLPPLPPMAAPDGATIISYMGRSSPGTMLIGDTVPRITSMDLGHLVVLDYRGLTQRTPTNVSTSTVPVIAPDREAFTEWDLTADGGQLVQFAFQLDTNGPPVRGGCVEVTPPGSSIPVCDQFGWLLDDFQISQAPKKAYDVRVTAAALQAHGYDHRSLGLGPGTAATLNVTVQNAGLFKVNAGHIDVLLFGQDGTQSTHRFKPDSFAMRAGESQTFAAPIPALPEVEQDYVVAVRVGLDEVLLEPGVNPQTYLDDMADDNCAVLNPNGVTETKPCGALEPEGLAAQPTFLLHAVEDLRVSFSVTPEQGRVGFARNIDVFVENRGNVVVHDAELKLTSKNLQAPDDRSSLQWTIEASPAPGQKASWSAIDLDKPAIGGLRLLQTARYLLSVSIVKEQPNAATPLASVATKLVASFDTFYSDDFAGGLDSQHPSAVTGALSATGNWSLAPGINTYLDPACCAWHFGSTENKTYPNAADDALQFPNVDLSTASKAVFSFAHRQDLEDGFDGARLEASTDGGTTWIPLLPFVPSPTAQDCPAGMVLLPVTGQPLCALPQVGGVCPSGTVTGSRRTTVNGLPVCAIAAVPGDCPTGLVHAQFEIAACSRPIQGTTCPSGEQFVPVHPGICARVTTSPSCPAGQTPLAGGYPGIPSYYVCVHIPAIGTCPPGTIGLTAANRECFVPAGYGSLLQSGTALTHPDPSTRDPATLVTAFSGDSRERAALQDGWQISEFDLAQIPGFTVPVELIRLAQEDFPTYLSKHGGVRGDGARTAIDEWCEPGKSTSDGAESDFCWLRENLHHEAPAPNPQAEADDVPPEPGHAMWWSGSSPLNWDPSSPTSAARAEAPRTRLHLDLPPLVTCTGDEPAGTRCLEQADRARLVYWVFDPSVAFFEPGRCGEGLTAHVVKANSPDTSNPRDGIPDEEPSTLGAVLQTLPSGWVKRAIPLQNANFDAKAVLRVTLTYADPNDRWSIGQSNAPAGPTARFCNNPLRGVAVDDVRVEIVRTASGRDTLHVEGPRAPAWFPVTSDVWSTTQVNAFAGDAVRWRAAERLPATADAWDPRPDVVDHNGDPATAWVFSDPPTKRYPANARDRIVTPTISLQEIGGSTATLSFWERFDTDMTTSANGRIASQLATFQDRRTVLVQVFEPTANGVEAWGPFQPIDTFSPRYFQLTLFKSSTACQDAAANNDWCRREVDVSSLIGKKVRFAFEVETGRRIAPLGTYAPAVDSELGLFWMIDDVSIAAATLAGGPVQLRVHVGTDASLNDGGLSIDNPQLVGFQYQRNVALIPDLQGTVYGAAQRTLHIDGLVRNLAEGLEKELVVQARVVHVKGCVADPAPQPVASVRGQLVPDDVEDGWGRTRPFTLAPAGSMTAAQQANDRARFTFDVAIPEGGCLSSTYRVELRAMQKTPAGLVDVADDNLGDHERNLVLVVASENDLEVPPSRLAVTPRIASLGPDGTTQAIAFSALVQNSGTTDLTGLSVEFAPTRTPLDGGADEAMPPVRIDVPSSELPPPGGSRWVNATWRATSNGFYAVAASVTGQFPDTPFPLPALAVGQVLVGQSPLYWSDDLEGDVSGWVAEHALSAPMTPECPGAPNTNGAPPANAPQELGWHLSTERSFDGAHSFFVGTPDPGAFPYPSGRDELLTTPMANLLFLRNVAGAIDNPFIPDLTFRYMPLFGDPTLNPNNGALVQAYATPADGLSQVGPGTQRIANYDGQVRCNNPLVLQSLNFQSADAYRGHTVGVWKAGSVRQSTVANPINNQPPIPLAGSFVKDVFRFGTGDANAVGMFVDSVSFSAYRSSVAPTRQDVSLSTGAEKVFNFRVQNMGVARDTFLVTVDPALTQPTAFLEGGSLGAPLIPIDVVTPELELDAGASGVATIRIRVPNDPDLAPVTAGDVVVAVTSATDRNQVSVTTIHVDRIDTTDLPHLEVELRRPGTDLAVVEEQQPVSFLAVVRNDGRATARATDLLVIACPSTNGGLGPDLQACLDARAGGRTADAAWPTVLKTASVPSLPSPQDVQREDLAKTTYTKTVSWIPEIGKPGLYHIVAVADAKSLLRQYEPRSVGVLDLHVQPMRRPDLVVEGLRVQDAAGRDVQEAFSGDLLRVSGTVRNEGTAAAHDVEAVLSAQHELLGQRIGTLQPGESRDLATTWVATAGNYLVTLEAHTTTPLDDLSNNAARLPVGVRQGVVAVHVAPDAVTLAPGATIDLLLDLANKRDSAVSIEMPVELPAELTLQGMPARLDLPRGGQEQVLLSLAASPFALTGTGEVRILVQSADGVALGESVILVAIGDALRVVSSADPVVTPPGHASAIVHLLNQGGETHLTLAARPPADWKAILPVRQVSLLEGQARDIRLEIDIPAGTPAGRHAVDLLAGTRVIGTVPVEVTSQPAWRSTLDLVRELDGRSEALATVTNIGNTAGTPDFAGNTSLLSVTPLPGVLAPGESATFRLSLQGEGSAAQWLLPGASRATGLAVQDRDPRFDLVRWDVVPATAAREGEPVTVRATLRNTGDVALAGVPVRVYSDGALVAAGEVPLGLGADQTLELAWRPGSGTHVVTVAAGEVGAQTAESALLDVGAASRGAPGPGAWALVILALAALAVRRRRP